MTEERINADTEHAYCKGQPIKVKESEPYLGSLVNGPGNWRVDFERRCAIAAGRFKEYKSVLCASCLPLSLRVNLFQVLIATVMLHGSECWVANPEAVLAEVRKKGWEYAVKMTARKKGEGGEFTLKKVRKACDEINVPGILIKRVLGYYSTLINAEFDNPARDAFYAKKEWFESWFFGIKWGEAEKLPKDWFLWNELMEKCVKQKKHKQTKKRKKREKKKFQ